MAEAARLRALEREKGRLDDEGEVGGGGGEDDGVREGQCGDGSGHSLHSDDMVSCTHTVMLLTWQIYSCIYIAFMKTQ